jgi:hypothetical protein
VNDGWGLGSSMSFPNREKDSDASNESNSLPWATGGDKKMVGAFCASLCPLLAPIDRGKLKGIGVFLVLCT